MKKTKRLSSFTNVVEIRSINKDPELLAMVKDSLANAQVSMIIYDNYKLNSNVDQILIFTAQVRSHWQPDRILLVLQKLLAFRHSQPAFYAVDRHFVAVPKTLPQCDRH